MVAIELIWYDTLIRWSESHFSHCGQWIQHLSLIIATTHLSVFAKHHWYGSRLSFLTFWLLSLSYILFANIIYKIDNIRSLCVVYLVATCTFVSPMFLSGPLLTAELYRLEIRPWQDSMCLSHILTWSMSSSVLRF